MQSNNKKQIWRIIIGGTVGNFNEWYNFLLYGYLASVMAKLFFPLSNKLLSLTLVFTLFAMSFFVRPLGGLIFGWIGDTYGRQRALLISLIAMAIPTFLMGCLPTYENIGIASPILLCILRILQGLSTGGEHTGSAIYVAEHAPPRYRSLWISSIPSSVALGILSSSAMVLVITNSMSNTQLLDWGWRLAYWLGTLFCIISILLRLNLPETPSFQHELKNITHRSYSISELFKKHEARKNLLLVFCLASCWGVIYQLLFIWMPTYITTIHHFNNSLGLKINSLCMLLFALLIIIFAYSADYISRKKLLISANIMMVILAYPLFILLSKGNLWQINIAMIILTIVFSLYVSTAFICMTEAFHTEIRYTGFSLAFNTGLAIFGGTCPLIATWLIQLSNNNASPAIYIIVMSMISLIACIFIKDKRGKSILN